MTKIIKENKKRNKALTFKGVNYSIVFLFSFIFIFSLPFSSSSVYDDCSIYGTCETPKDIISKINYTQISVNDSTLWNGNLWDDYRWLNIDGSNANQNIDIDYNITANNFNGDWNNSINYYNRTEIDTLHLLVTAGVLSPNPTYTDNGDGTLTIDSFDCALYDNPNAIGTLNKYHIDSKMFNLADNQTSYIIVDYNSGNPILDVTLDKTTINTANRIPVVTAHKEDLKLVVTSWDSWGSNPLGKLYYAKSVLDRFRHESGLSISANSNREVFWTKGNVYIAGIHKTVVPAFNSTNNTHLFFYKENGEWVSDYSTTQYDNTHYQGEDNLVLMNNNKFGVLFYFAGITDHAQGGYVLGTDEYIKRSDALLAQVPGDLPQRISTHGILVGRLIYEKGSYALNEDVQSAFVQDFEGGYTTDYNSLYNLPDLTQYVSYTGAINNVDLGNQNITANTGFFDWIGSISNKITKIFTKEIEVEQINLINGTHSNQIYTNENGTLVFLVE